MMNFLNVSDHCEVKFTYDNFVIKKVFQLCLTHFLGRIARDSTNRRDLCFLLLSRRVEGLSSPLGVSYVQAIRNALSSYMTLSNNSRFTLNLDGQKFSVIIRLLKPDDNVRTTDKMNILVSNQIYVGVQLLNEPSESASSIRRTNRGM